MSPDEPGKPKIIVDDDWKAQAQAEKQKLDQETKQSPAAGATGQVGEALGQHELPQASFSTLVSSLVTQILMSLGGYQDPRTRQRLVDLDLAKHYIDTLSVLETKTKGNLTEDEKKLLDHALYEARLQYVQIAQRLAGA